MHSTSQGALVFLGSVDFPLIHLCKVQKAWFLLKLIGAVGAQNCISRYRGGAVVHPQPTLENCPAYPGYELEPLSSL